MTIQFRSWTEGLAALRERAEEVRGLTETDGTAWPNTTNGDVITIASVIDPSLQARFRSSELGRRWDHVRDDAQRASIAPHHATYAKNREFWAAVAIVCGYLDEMPVPDLWGVLADHLGDAELRNAGPAPDGAIARFDGIKTYDDMWNAQRKFLADKRGADKLPPPAGMGGSDMTIPRSTNADVLQLATYWTTQLANAKQVLGYKTAVDKWHAAIADVDQLVKSGKPDDVYPKNNEFWRTSFDVAIQVAIGDESPSKWDMFVGSVKDSVTHLPENLEHAASKAADLVAEAGHGLGKIVNETGKGLLSGLGTPLLVGGGLLGLYLITRSRGRDEQGAED
ncbi:MAG TPA: hypothetical protein VMJ10_37590 [Kofleriaceae bacterium]|nr:hypothetical protein [Kofleriaceae bacterium]